MEMKIDHMKKHGLENKKQELESDITLMNGIIDRKIDLSKAEAALTGFYPGRLQDVKVEEVYCASLSELHRLHLYIPVTL